MVASLSNTRLNGRAFVTQPLFGAAQRERQLVQRVATDVGTAYRTAGWRAMSAIRRAGTLENGALPKRSALATERTFSRY